MAIDVDDVATDKDLEQYTLGASNLQDLLPDEWLDGDRKSARKARQAILDELLLRLKRRRPPIHEDDLLDVTELKQAVIFGTLAALYNGAIKHAESPYIAQAKHYRGLYRDESDSLQPHTRAGVAAGSLSIRMSRG